jgi:hypothetical protein
MDVYGKPSTNILGRLTARQIAELDRYVGHVASTAYRIAFACGRRHTLSEIKRLIENTE